MRLTSKGAELEHQFGKRPIAASCQMDETEQALCAKCVRSNALKDFAAVIWLVSVAGVGWIAMRAGGGSRLHYWLLTRKRDCHLKSLGNQITSSCYTASLFPGYGHRHLCLLNSVGYVTSPQFAREVARPT